MVSRVGDGGTEEPPCFNIEAMEGVDQNICDVCLDEGILLDEQKLEHILPSTYEPSDLNWS